MRVLALLFVLIGAACAGIARHSTLEDSARDYVHLVLEIGAHEEGYIDAYYGPAKWKTEAEAHPRTIAELKTEADRIQAALRAMSAARPPIERRRAAWLMAQTASARFRLDMIEGAHLPFRDEAERLFALRPDLRPLETYDPVLARIEALVPGQGPLNERVEAFRNRYTIPSDRLSAVMDAAIAECRRRTRAHVQLPDNERFSMEFVTRQSWSAYNWYKGDNQSLIQVNTDLPIAIDRAVAATLYPLAGLDPATAPALDALRHALADLSGARLTIAALYLDGEIGRERALELTQRYQLISRARADQSLAFTEHYRSYVINYATGEDLVRAYVERAGQSEAAQWAAYQRVLSEPTLPKDLAP